MKKCIYTKFFYPVQIYCFWWCFQKSVMRVLQTLAIISIVNMAADSYWLKLFRTLLKYSARDANSLVATSIFMVLFWRLVFVLLIIPKRSFQISVSRTVTNLYIFLRRLRFSSLLANHCYWQSILELLKHYYNHLAKS